MLKSLFSGVSGLQSHQIAMDVESNNIANVNTVGFKYSRANFSDLLAQTNQIATAPQGDLGGKNNVQIGLGATVASVTRIHSQGSIQNTDKNTDVAIQGDGFFIVSGDAGNTYKYSRSGDFKFDANGNFVDNNGFVIQGWLRDELTGKVDSTAPITSINIPPGLTTPAQASKEVTLKANLNSGSTIESFSPTYAIKDLTPYNTGPGTIIDSDGNPVVNPPAFEDVGVMFNEQGEAFNLQAGQGIWAGFRPAEATSGALPGPFPLAADTTYSVTFVLDDGVTQVTATYNALAGESQAQVVGGYQGAINALSSQTGIVATANTAGDGLDIENLNNDANAAHNITILAGSEVNSAFETDPNALFETAYRYEYAANAANLAAGATKVFNTIEDLRQALQNEAQINIDGDLEPSPPAPAGTPLYEGGAAVEITPEGRILVRNGSGINTDDDYDMQIAVTGIKTSSISQNIRFTEVMQSLNAALPAGTAGTTLSQSFNAATHSSSIDIYDSLGSKHTLRMEFRKTDVDLTTGSTWEMKLSVPEPATIDTIAPFNEISGQIRFNNDGSLSTYNPINFSFTGNNGSAPDQQVRLDFGTANAFDGMTSFDSRSATSGISQDGFTGGDIVGIRIDQSGTLIGSFSNGRAFGLAQIGMAKFANNEGLAADGGNIYLQSANSGDPIIGEAATAGRGFIQSAALEASNVDLSRSLTQLIIIQRGYQANGKTITTSDQLLNTLIGLKQ